jgi:hypothetical protein
MKPSQILGMFEKEEWKVPIRMIKHFYTEICYSLQMGFHEISYLEFLIKVVNTSHVLKKHTKIMVTLHEHLDTFL